MLEEDEQSLRELAKSCRDAKEQNRYLALHTLAVGYPVKDAAAIFCVDETTIYRWIDQWQKEKSLADRPRTGRPPVLDEKKKEEIKKLVEENNPKKHGMNASTWDTKELQRFFSRNGKAVSQETLRRYLKEMGARYIKANLRYAEADVKEQESFARQFFSDVEHKPNAVVIFFEDEMSAGCSPKKGYGWTFEKRLVVNAPQRKRERLNCFGAVNPFEGDIVEISSTDPKAPTFIRLLRKIESKYPGKRIWMYVDGTRVHTSKKVEEFLDKHLNIELRFLPPYSPDLNPQEQWWNFKRKKLLNNRSFSSTHQLATTMSWFAKKTPAEQIMSVCSLTPLENLLR